MNNLHVADDPHADFIVHITNCLIKGEERLDQPGGSWYRGLIRLSLDGHDIELRQQHWVVVGTSWQDVRDQWRHTTDLHFFDATEQKRDALVGLAEKLAVVLGFLTASEVAVAGWTYAVGAQRGLWRTTTGRINDFSPVIDTRDGALVRRCIEQIWNGYARESADRNLPAVFHYLALAERDETPLELKLAILFIVLEQLKHSFAVSNRYVFIAPHFHMPGTATATKASRRGFAKLLGEMFAGVGMTPATRTFTDVRNEILHSGLSARPFAELVALQGDVIAAIREYLLRLLGYTGPFLTGRHGGQTASI